MPELLKSIQIPRNWKREKRIGTNKYEECTLCDFFTRCDYKASNSTPNPKNEKRKGKKKQPSVTSSRVYTNGKRSPQLEKYTDDKIEQTERGEKGLICV